MNEKTEVEKSVKNSSQDYMDELKERVKELDCLYGLTDIVKDRKLTKDEALKKINTLIPPAWQYPE